MDALVRDPDEEHALAARHQPPSRRAAAAAPLPLLPLLLPLPRLRLLLLLRLRRLRQLQVSLCCGGVRGEAAVVPG